MEYETEYRVIGLDMDGTCLNDAKEIDPQTREAIHEALRRGKEVVFCTGRSYSEMKETLADFPDMHYLLGENGGLLFDLRSMKPLYKAAFPPETVAKIKETVRGRDVMTTPFIAGVTSLNRSQAGRMAHYQMAVYAETIPRTSAIYEDVYEELEKEGVTAEKINLYHTSAKEREISRRMLMEMGVEAELTDSEVASLELTPPDTDKGSALRHFSELTGIPLEQMIMVGDADNDVEGLRSAGLGVAMGNANEHVKAVADVTVADNNHAGCAEAIRRWLLGDERPERDVTQNPERPERDVTPDPETPGNSLAPEETVLKVIARIESDFSEKFGIPRQSGLVPELRARIVFEPEYRNPHALTGLEHFSHLWLVWQFSKAIRKDGGWSPTVTPPRLGGNKRMGVFATRSPFRPNPLGLSCVRLEKVEQDPQLGPVLWVKGADLLDGTPIYDIKPYLAYADAHPDAVCGYVDEIPFHQLEVEFPQELLEKLPADKRSAAVGILRQDPRPSYQHDPARRYGTAFAGYDIRFYVDGDHLRVCEVVKL